MISVSSKSQYGLRALVFLAQKDRLVSIADISEHEHIPYDFLEKIIQRLKKEGILLSERGAHGGYALAKNPEDISLKMVLEALGDMRPPAKCIDGSCEMSEGCASRSIWSEVYHSIEKELSRVTLDRIAEHASHATNYITQQETISCLK
jgi:Rrf2 family iron-sulfur cluster assembly transcriptional regulator